VVTHLGTNPAQRRVTFVDAVANSVTADEQNRYLQSELDKCIVGIMMH